MKKFRILFVAIAVCAISYTGYTAYEKANMSAEELAIMENVEALSSGESGITGQWEYPSGRPHRSECGASLGWGNHCRVSTTECDGGGSGCNTKQCNNTH